MAFNKLIRPPVGAQFIGAPPILKSNDQSRSCHAERSEASGCPSREILRFAQDDKRPAMITNQDR